MDAPAIRSKSNFEHGIAQFSFGMYGMVEKHGNELVSPYSVASALCLLMLGTDGTTKDQMMSSIFKDEKLKYVNISYKGLNDKLVSKTDTGVTLSIANRLFENQMYTLLDPFTKRALEYYGSKMELLDFSTEPEQSRLQINNWIASQTKDKILDMIPENILDADTLLVLANAIYFKGTWQRPFDQKQTIKMNFVVDENHDREVDMMFAEYMTLSGENAEFSCKALHLPYGDGQLAMVFMLPNDKGGIKKLEDRLTFDSFHSIVSGLHDQKTMINIPKFVVEAKYDLKPILKNLGITEIFDPATADFSKMVPPEINSQGIYVSDARHKTYVEVNEEGSEAAGATTIEVEIKSMPFEFRADHPFVFVIYDQETEIPLFIGRYADPPMSSNSVFFQC